MKLIFYQKEIYFVRRFLKENQDAIAFWFAPGLSSYRFLPETTSISVVFIEESILDDFTREYGSWIGKYQVEPFSSTEETQFPGHQKPICFFAASDTIVRSLKTVLDHFQPHEYKLFCRGNEHAPEAAMQSGLTATVVRKSILQPGQYSLLVLANDWGLMEQKLIYDFAAKEINSVCIQESSIDFNARTNRMGHCSFPVFQGVATLANLDLKQRICAVVGNPRFEELRPVPLPLKNKVLVNVNFTYGVLEKVRDQWVADIVAVCNELQVEFLLSQHPRDRGHFEHLPVLKSNALKVHDALRDCSVLISRFSALITESICLGRPAIYFNPHREQPGYAFEPDNQMLFMAFTKDELMNHLGFLLRRGAPESASDFLPRHLGNTPEGQASHYIALALRDISVFPLLRAKISLLKRGKLAIRILKRKLWRQVW